MKHKVSQSGWSVLYSHARLAPPKAWTCHGPLESEEEAIVVAGLFVSQGLIVDSICENGEQRLDSDAILTRLGTISAPPTGIPETLAAA